MSATTTPPAAPSPASPPPAPPSPRGGQAAAVIAILVAVLGVILIVGTMVTSAFSTVVSSRTVEETTSTPVAGVTELDVEAEASRLTITFDDVDDAVLDVSGQGGGWTLSRDGSTLEVRGPRGVFLGWWAATSRATLTLPRELDGRLDASLGLGAGELRAEGAFRDLELSVDAGQLTVEGSARELSVDIGAGRADLSLADVAEIDLSLSAGALDARFSGNAPDSVTVTASAGSVTAVLPRAEYAVESSVEFGRFDNRLSVSASSPRSVSVEVSAGSVSLRDGR